MLGGWSWGLQTIGIAYQCLSGQQYLEVVLVQYISMVGGLIGISLPQIIALADTVMINVCDVVHSIEKTSWTCLDKLLPWEVHRIWKPEDQKGRLDGVQYIAVGIMYPQTCCGGCSSNIHGSLTLFVLMEHRVLCLYPCTTSELQALRYQEQSFTTQSIQLWRSFTI